MAYSLITACHSPFFPSIKPLRPELNLACMLLISCFFNWKSLTPSPMPSSSRQAPHPGFHVTFWGGPLSFRSCCEGPRVQLEWRTSSILTLSPLETRQQPKETTSPLFSNSSSWLSISFRHQSTIHCSFVSSGVVCLPRAVALSVSVV